MMDHYAVARQPYSSDTDVAKSRPLNQHPNGTSKATSDPAPAKAPPVCDVKPRLTKDQHDLLEAHFQKQHKPSTSTKKNFADHLGVPIDKINNWFQNRRAKVKQDLKKQQMQQLQSVNLYQATLPIHSQHPLQQDQCAPPPAAPEFYSVNQNQEFNHPLLPGDPILAHSQPEALSVQIPAAQDYHVLTSITESTQPGSVDTLLQSLIGAGYDLPTTNGASLSALYAGLNQPGIPPGIAGDSRFAFQPSNIDMNGWSIFANPTFNPQDFATAASQAMDQPASVSSESSFSGAVSTSAAQSTNGTNAMPSGNSLYSSWSEDKPASSTAISPATIQDDPFDLSDASVQQNASVTQSQNPNFTWAQSPQNVVSPNFQPAAEFYQQSNHNSQSVLSSPEQNGIASLPTSHSEVDLPSAYPDEAFQRRRSMSALGETKGALSALNRPLDSAFKPPAPPSSLAARRRQPRPALLNPAAFRTASYTSGMPSPGRPGQTLYPELRRARSQGLAGGVQNGRIQKPAPGSAQRSPMYPSFAEAAQSPKFARHAPGYAAVVSTPGMPGSTGSLAPPTPITPSEVANEVANGITRFPSWQTNGIVKSGPENGRPEGQSVTWTIDPEISGLPLNVASPPNTPLNAAQLAQNQSRLAHGQLQRTAPPQSAPPTQQSFPRDMFVPQPQSVADAPSSAEFAVPAVRNHLRRPSLPEAAHGVQINSQVPFTVPVPNSAGDLQAYPPQYRQAIINGMNRMNPMNGFDEFKQISTLPHEFSVMASAPNLNPVPMADLYIHEYSPPRMTAHAVSPPRVQDCQPKSYVFANRGPHDFQQISS